MARGDEVRRVSRGVRCGVARCGEVGAMRGDVRYAMCYQSYRVVMLRAGRGWTRVVEARLDALLPRNAEPRVARAAGVVAANAAIVNGGGCAARVRECASCPVAVDNGGWRQSFIVLTGRGRSASVRGAPLPPLPKHCKSAVSRWSDVRGPSETSDWPSGIVEAVWPIAVSGSVGSVATAVPAVVPRPPCGSVGSDWPLRIGASRQCLRQCGGSTWRYIGQSDVSDGPRTSDHRDTADLQCFGSGGSGAPLTGEGLPRLYCRAMIG